MRLIVVCGALLAPWIYIAQTNAADIESGLQVGADVGAFGVTKQGGCDDGVAAGASLCYR